MIFGLNGDDTITADIFSGGSGTDVATNFRSTQGNTKDNTIP